MKRNDFEVCIVGGMEIPAAGKVKLPHGQEYKLALTNHGTQRAEAAVEIEGCLVGHWPVPPRCTLVVSQPAEQSDPFTFLRPGTAEAAAAGVVGEKAGLVSVLFVPEKLADLCLLADVPATSLPADVPLDPTPAATTAPFRPDHARTVEVALRLVHGAVPSVEVQAQDRRWHLRREVMRLRQRADQAAEEEFDFPKARQLDREVATLQRELDRLDMHEELKGEVRAEVQAALSSIAPAS